MAREVNYDHVMTKRNANKPRTIEIHKLSRITGGGTSDDGKVANAMQELRALAADAGYGANSDLVQSLK